MGGGYFRQRQQHTELVADGRGATFWNLAIVGMPVHGTREGAAVRLKRKAGVFLCATLNKGQSSHDGARKPLSWRRQCKKSCLLCGKQKQSRETAVAQLPGNNMSAREEEPEPLCALLSDYIPLFKNTIGWIPQCLWYHINIS